MSWTYDGLGRVIGKGQTIGTITKSVGYSYTNGDLTSLATPSGQTVTYGYTNHRITSVSVNGTTILSAATYDPFGPANAWTWGNATTVSRTFDEDGNPAHIVTAAVTNTYTVDNASRITGLNDSGLASNSFTFGYDLLDRVTSGTSTALSRGYTYDANSNQLTTTGTVSFTDSIAPTNNHLSSTAGGIARTYDYDTANRRATMTVTGQPVINYTFDNDNRLTQVAQGTNVLGFGYDIAGRRTTITLPNSIIGTFGFDNADQLTSISYMHGATTVGTLGYGYDLGGRRTSMTGTLAAFVPPTAVPSLTYDGTNRLTSWGGKAITYDTNGNITNFGTATYTWNARNQLTATSGGGATFAYDAEGRRVSLTVSGVTTPYLYDGQNPAMISSNQMLAGAGLDEIYAQINSSGTTSYLRDGVNSAVAITNSSAATTANYSYSPYGDSAGTGTATTPLQYTGRENDSATGLYYYRARYYSPQLGRFIAEDPIGLGGGTNYYAYTNGNPISLTDPYGLWAWGDPVDQGIVDAAAGFGDTISWGATSGIRNLMGTNDAVNKCSTSYTVGVAGGVIWGLAFGGATLGRHAANVGAGEFFADSRAYSTVQNQWSSSVRGYLGKYELHHWYTPQSMGGTSAGWNLVAVSPWLNNAMSDDGLLYNMFKVSMVGSYLGAAGAVPTAIANSNHCGC
jgi:RHS repeat-associated protein